MLSLAAPRILDRLEIELAHHGDQRRWPLAGHLRYFIEYGIHRHSIAPGLREVVAFGFVEITEHGLSTGRQCPTDR